MFYKKIALLSLFVSFLPTVCHEIVENANIVDRSVPALNLPFDKKTPQIQVYCEQLFIKNDQSSLKPLLALLNGVERNIKFTMYSTIIDWCFENRLDNTYYFITSLSSKALSCSIKGSPYTLKEYILKKALRYHDNKIVQHLLSFFSSQELLAKDLHEKNYLNYAIEYSNSAGASLISDYITSYGSSSILMKFLKYSLIGVAFVGVMIFVAGYVAAVTFEATLITVLMALTGIRPR